MVVSKRRNGFAALLVLVLGGALAYALLVGKPRPPAESAPAYEPPVVEIIEAVPSVRALTVETQGTVHPRREIQLVSQVSGKVEEVSSRFAQGEFFAAGESLVKIEDVDYRLAIARAESNVAASRQVVAEEEGRALQAKREWRDLGSQQANDLFLRKPQLVSAKAALKAAEADLATAQLNLKRTELIAPFNGRIKEKLVDVGQYIAPGSPIATIYDTDVVEVRLPLTDRQVALLDLPLHYREGSEEGLREPPVVLRAQFGNREWEWRGTVVRTDATIDMSSRVVYAVARVEKPFAIVPGSARPPLSPGLFVHATIDGRPLQGITELPRSALRTDGTVLVVDAKSQALSRKVDVLQSNSTTIWTQGLAQGERVIVRQATPVIPGMEVALGDSVNSVGGES